MIQVGSTDVFERKYLQKFRAFAGKFGEFVVYERDRGARDLGLHLTHKLSSGKERLSSALCWFQMKGIMASSLPKKVLEKTKEIKLSLEVSHLKYWYLQPMPTYLIVYVESGDLFLIVNIQEYVAQHWGKAILDLEQKKATVAVPIESELDEQAFNLILIKTDIGEWKKALGTDDESARLCRRDYELIWQLGTAKKRRVKHRFIFLEWQSKCRSQFEIQESSIKDPEEWRGIREHWQYQMKIDDLEESYPYIEFFRLSDESDDSTIWDEDEDEYDDTEHFQLKNGSVVSGVNYANEFIKYIFGAKLNKLGYRLFDSVATLHKVGLIEITPGKKNWISIAPWNERAV